MQNVSHYPEFLPNSSPLNNIDPLRPRIAFSTFPPGCFAATIGGVSGDRLQRGLVAAKAGFELHSGYIHCKYRKCLIINGAGEGNRTLVTIPLKTRW
jgi:hypothetical protein